MHKSRYVIAGLFFLLLGVFIFNPVFLDRTWVDRSFSAKNAALDLHTWNMEKSAVSLQGEWAFYWKMLDSEVLPETSAVMVQVPNSWEIKESGGHDPYGYAVYRLQVTGLKPGGQYGFKMLDQLTSYRLFVNGIVVAKNGKVGKDKSSYRPEWHSATGIFAADKEGKALFSIEISNYDYNRGGFWNQILIGNVFDIMHYRMLKILGDMFLFASLLVMGTFFLGMYLINTSQKDTLFFSLFCIMMSLQIYFTGERLDNDFLPWISWGTHVRLEYLSGYLLLPLFGLYVDSRFPFEGGKFARRIFVVLAYILAAIVMFTPHFFYSGLINIYKYLVLLSSPHFIIVFTRVFNHKRGGAHLSIAAFIILLAGLVSDTFYCTEYSAMPYATFIFMICFSLITMAKYAWVQKENEKLELKATLDPFTGFCNRTYLHTFFNNNRHKQFYLMFLDLDKFKEVNDTYGHDNGDIVLKEISARLKKEFRSTDIICRYGGDEFIVLVMDESEAGIGLMADRMIEAVKQDIVLDQTVVNMGVSIGICYYPQDSADIEELIRLADQKMYEAKEAGGMCYRIF